MNLNTLAKTIGAELRSDGNAAGHLEIDGIAPLDQAGPRQITFLSNPRYAKKLAQTQAAAVILGSPDQTLPLPQLIHPNPYAAMAMTSNLFYQPHHTYRGQSELAIVDKAAKVASSVTLYPFCYIERDAVIGEGCVLYPQVYIGEGATIGAGSVLFPGVTVMPGCTVGKNALIHAGTVIGGDGFGFAPTKDGILKIPQIGAVTLGDDVEIGPLSTIDRGAFNDTVLAKGCKLDSQVHIAHGVEIGEYAMICGQSAIAGSTRIGKRLIMAGHTAIGPSLEIGDHVTLGPKAGLTRSTDVGGEYLGMPAVPGKDWRRQVVAFERLPELLKTVKELSSRLAALENKTVNENEFTP